MVRCQASPHFSGHCANREHRVASRHGAMRCPMIKESHRVMIALLALLACVAIARADSMTVSTGCGPGRGEPCMGYVNVSSTAASGSLFPIYFSGLADQP